MDLECPEDFLARNLAKPGAGKDEVSALKAELLEMKKENDTLRE